MKHITQNFYDLESKIIDCYDESVLIDYDEEDAFHKYIERIFQCYIQELIIQDIISSADDTAKLLELVGNIDISIPKDILSFYVDKAI